MDIGSKIKDARAAAALTQEQAAEALNVSRQTVSNWENGKTWPDIISVVKMSDLYGVSLDRLLKEEKPLSDYVSYLAESTDTVSVKNKLAKTVLIAVYLGIWAASLIVFWFFAAPTDSMAYGLMFLWILLPVTTLVISAIIGRNNYWGKWKWLSAPVFGLMYMLAEYATFQCANMVSSAYLHINMPNLEFVPAGAAVSLLGLALGSAVRHIKRRKNC